MCASAAAIPATPSFADTVAPQDSTPVDSTTPTPDPTATPTAAPTAEPTPDPTPGPTADPTPDPTPAAPTPPPVNHSAPPTVAVGDPDAPLAAIASARLRSTSVRLEDARFVGTVTVALADGSTSTVLKITAARVTLGGYSLNSIDAAARTASLAAATVTLNGPVTLYCTSLTGSVASGVVALDASNPPPPGTALPSSLESVTIGLVAMTSSSAALAGAVESVR